MGAILPDRDGRIVAVLRSRLAVKVSVLIVVVLILGFGASTILTIWRESQLLVEQSKIAARRLTATLVASIEGAMLQERPDVTRTVLQELKTGTPVEGLTIFRRTGVEAFTDLATAMEVDKNAGLPKEVLDNIRKMARPPGETTTGPMFLRAVESLHTQESLDTRDGATFFTLHYPILNQERCQGCHGSDHTVRAVVRVATSMEPVLAEVRRHRNRQILIGALTIVAAAGVLTVAMRRVVIRPINQLSVAARRVGEGDFEARAPVTTQDEIGQLGAVFNDMTARLSTAYQELGHKNTELTTALQNLQESRERLELLEQLKGELSKFVPEAVQRLLEQNPNATELEKKTVEVSVLFLDIAGYTKLSEQLEPRRLNQLVQTHFSSYLEQIQRQHGDINETAGDGLMVIFQAQPGATDHALNATRAAFAIRQRTEQLNEEYGGVFPAIGLHMGINSGEALVGATKIGGAGGQRWTFTATGPTTNLAARFAGSAETGEIVVGPTTAERIRSQFVLENLGERSFKNVSQPIRVFRVIPPGVYEKIV
jgi:class 3 adenylate cyclase/HAMP domain-containing protein